MKFGLRNVVPLTAAPHWSALRGKYGGRAYSAPATTVDYLRLLPVDTGFLGNDSVGDCFWAAQYHGRQARTLETTGAMVTEPDSVVLGAYSAATGFSPGDAATDQGTDPAQGFGWITANGLPTSSGTPVRLLAAIELDPRNLGDCLEAMDLCCGLSVGADMPLSVAQAPTPPQVWDAGPSSGEGHEFWVGRADPGFADVGVVSWGLKFSLTRAFWDSCVNQVTALVYADWFEATGKSPFGMAPEQLEAEMQPLRSGMIP